MKRGPQEHDTKLVRTGYDRAADSYAAGRDKFKNQKYLHRFTQLLQPPARVLDIGCGSGKPIDSFLSAHGYDVIGIDISPKQIELAKRLVPKARFEVRDMLEIKPSDFSVDGIVSFYAIFHTPRDRHADLLKTLASLLRPGGTMLVTMGADEYEGRDQDFHGVEMYWSHFGAAKNRELVEAAGSKINRAEIDSSAGEHHQVILATRNATSSDDVLAFVNLCEKLGIDVWIDGGWAVDALLGEQTRPHGDLDVVIQHKDVAVLRDALGARGYRDRPRDDTSPWNFVLSDKEGREIDVHAITFDDYGNGLYGPAAKGESYPAASLTGRGEVRGRAVKCISPEWLVKFHAGYELDENDYHDVVALSDRFGIELPKEYRNQA
jgi:lincosamide nucleotidyltransferase A/C/D/E